MNFEKNGGSKVVHLMKKIQARKTNIQKSFYVQLGFSVNFLKQGYVSTNEGNVARRCFKNSKFSAAVIGINKDLNARFHTILQTISYGFEVDAQKSKMFALQTTRKFVKLYPW